MKKRKILLRMTACAALLTLGSLSTAFPQHSDPAKQAEHMALHDLLPHGDEDVKAVQNGSWFSSSTWNTGTIPATGQDVLVPANLTVTFDGQSSARLDVVRVDGTLQFAHNTNNTLIVDTLICTMGSELLIGSESNPVQPSTTTRIIIAPVNGFDSGDPAATAIDTAWDWHQLSRGVVAHGKTRIYGAAKTVWDQLASAADAGDTTVTLTNTPSGWAVGDQVVITGTSYLGESWNGSEMVWNGSEDEERTITAINGNTITLSAPLDYDHVDRGTDVKGRPMRPYIANFTRNVTFETEGGESIPTQQRGHTMFMHNPDVIVKYAAFNHLGRTDKSRDLDDFLLDSSGKRVKDGNGDLVDGARTNIRGRYPFHFHRTGIMDENPVFAVAEGNAVWKSPGLGFVHHDSAADFVNNASYDCFGSHFVGETGNEIGIWQDNIAIRGASRMNFKNSHQQQNHDVGRPGAGYWFVGRVVGMVGNVAAGHAQVGIGHMTRGPDDIEVRSIHTEFGKMSARYQDTMQNANPHIHNHNDNVVLASNKGFAVAKSNADQGHAARSMINGLTAWNVSNAVNVQYTNFYSFVDLTAIAQPGEASTGIFYNAAVIDMVTNRAYVEGFDVGVGKFRPEAGPGTPSWGSLEFPFIDVQLVNNNTDFENFTSPSSAQILSSGDLTPNRLYIEFGPESDFYADPAQSDRKVVIDGWIWDSVKDHRYVTKWDLWDINNRFLEGHYLDGDGNKVILVEEPIMDSATGDWVILEIPVIMDPDWSFAGSGSASPYLGPLEEVTLEEFTGWNTGWFGDGTITGSGDIQWTYTNVNSGYDLDGSDAVTLHHGQWNVGKLEATVAAHLLEINLTAKRVVQSSGTGEIRLKINGITHGDSGVIDGTSTAISFTDIDTDGPVDIEILSIGDRHITLDDLEIVTSPAL